MDCYVSLDLETTGLNPKTDKIIEIGAIRVENGVCRDTFESFVNPGRRLEEKITELTGIEDKDLADAPEISEILPEFLKFAGELPLLGHSVLFDYSFVKKAAVNQRLSFERKGVDTLKIARKYLSELPHRSLDYLCTHYQIPHHAHRAAADAKATIALYEILWREFGQAADAASVFTPAGLNFQVKKDSPITKSQKERLYKLIRKHKLNTIYDPDKLTKSEASRYTDQILAKYGR